MSEGYVQVMLSAPGVISTSPIPQINETRTLSFDSNGFAKLQLNYNYSYNTSDNKITIIASYMPYDTSEPISLTPYHGTINYNKATGGSQSYTH